jgi:hypothetical protein
MAKVGGCGHTINAVKLPLVQPLAKRTAPTPGRLPEPRKSNRHATPIKTDAL